ncbi:MAG: hypothetical protein DLM54_10565 [Acidimicrobiales bacterium]|nr:MAG: hypothetical protein DLM54_10565 [Acidimicrobiales bacterium]
MDLPAPVGVEVRWQTWSRLVRPSRESLALTAWSRTCDDQAEDSCAGDRQDEASPAPRVVFWYAFGMAQLVTRVSEQLLAEVDALVNAGAVASRSDAVRTALSALVDRRRRDRIGTAIAEGYRRMPQTDREVDWADAATVGMIAEEPW